MRKSYLEKLRDPRWQKKRLEILERDDFTCQSCGSSHIELHVHHIEYAKGDPWQVGNQFLATLCKDCHVLSEKALNRMLPLSCAWDSNRQVAMYYTPDIFGIYDQYSGFSFKVKIDQFAIFAGHVVDWQRALPELMKIDSSTVPY